MITTRLQFGLGAILVTRVGPAVALAVPLMPRLTWLVTAPVVGSRLTSAVRLTPPTWVKSPATQRWPQKYFTS